MLRLLLQRADAMDRMWSSMPLAVKKRTYDVVSVTTRVRSFEFLLASRARAEQDLASSILRVRVALGVATGTEPARPARGKRPGQSSRVRNTTVDTARAQSLTHACLLSSGRAALFSISRVC